MSVHYTAQSLPAVDAYIAGHLARITDEVVALLGGDLEAVVLGGGFGRGEGSVAIAPDGAMHVVNDYDIEVVHREGAGGRVTALWMQLRYRRRLEELAERLARELGVKQIDLALRAPSAYRGSAATKLAEYDLRTGHRLLWGERDPLAAMRVRSPQEIPAFEGTWLLRSRGNGLLLARLYLRDGGLADGKQEYFAIELNKAALAMGDAFFILAGAYHNSYAVRAARIADVVPDDFGPRDELCALYRRAAAYKLDPRVGFDLHAAPGDAWRRIAALYLAGFLCLESLRLGRRFAGVLDYGEWAAAQPAPGALARITQHLKRAAARLVSALPPTAIPLRLRYQPALTVFFTFLLLDCHLRGEPRSMARLRGLLGSSWPRAAHPLGVVTRDFLMLTHPQGEQGRYLSTEYEP